MTLMTFEQIEKFAMGIMDLSSPPYRGPRRLKKRLAKRVLREQRRYPTWMVGAALKTKRRPLHKKLRKDWVALTEEEQAARRLKMILTLASPLGAFFYRALTDDKYTGYLKGAR